VLNICPEVTASTSLKAFISNLDKVLWVEILNHITMYTLIVLVSLLASRMTSARAVRLTPYLT
jgi:hypothetical protein